MNFKVFKWACWASPVAQMVKNLPAMWETQAQSLDQEDPLKMGTASHSSILLSGEFHGQRSLAGYSPWGRRESDTTERLSLHFKWPGQGQTSAKYVHI